jgi:hypothetical protein
VRSEPTTGRNGKICYSVGMDKDDEDDATVFAADEIAPDA